MIAVVGAGVLLLALMALVVSLRSFPSYDTSGSERTFSLGSFPLQATPSPPRAAPIIVNWTTKSEVNTAGFNLYRAENPAGPFAQINGELIPAAYDPVTGGSYVFTDTNVLTGTTYYYQLEDVEVNGTRTRYDKLITVTARAPSENLLGMTTSAWFVVAGMVLLIGLGAFAWTVRRK